ncbi:MAG: hypothetical protein GY942_25095 [Aestuariibacter sp.]|nr:hypothetical protein [Aestuariibacter sp.]
MNNSAAKLGDLIKATDIHNVINPDSTVVPQACNFVGKIGDGCIDNVQINSMSAAVQGSKAKNLALHVPFPPATSFSKPPTNEGEIMKGSQTVLIGGKAAARHDDICQTCTDGPGPSAKVVVMGMSNVFIGG